MNLVIGVFTVYIFFHTFSYAKVVWRENNKFGSIGISLLALAILIIPIFRFFFKI